MNFAEACAKVLSHCIKLVAHCGSCSVLAVMLVILHELLICLKISQ